MSDNCYVTMKKAYPNQVRMPSEQDWQGSAHATLKKQGKSAGFMDNEVFAFRFETANIERNDAWATQVVVQVRRLPQNVVGIRTFTYYRRGEENAPETEYEEIEYSQYTNGTWASGNDYSIGVN